MDCPGADISAWPLTGTLRMVKGDPFGFRLVVRDADGAPVDVSSWQWRGTVASDRLRLEFEWAADDTGVDLWLRGDDTARLSSLRPGRFDVACMQPTAGEGVTVYQGDVITKPRVGEPLRNDPDAVPGREEEAIPA